ncbi:MAG: hypothetical protein DMG39_14760 [Acidobacteria bacterium]|nr:MAG: hypothetical protein DMG39_14760 [Acidobacteriota bacterium]
MSDTVSAFIKAFSYLLAGEGVWGGLGKGTPFSALIEAISKDSTGVEAVCVWASALMRPVIIGTAAAAIPAIASSSFLQSLEWFNLCIIGGGMIASVLEDLAAHQIDAGSRVKKWPRL